MSVINSEQFSASDVDKIVGERIRRRRILTGLTQDQLGEALGVSYQQIQKYETGANRVSAGRLYLLAERLNVSPGWFFDGLTDGLEESEDDLQGSSRFAIECVRNLARINDERSRAAILNLIRTLADADNSADVSSDDSVAMSSAEAKKTVERTRASMD
ncbi:helix-turn-helix domain-containing protein [Henriciella litoralis]|uniref:helix-turn-helix domain-containing protein n=1 Tax=Henriciella litoralis TaxID=568102 RepID=UPI000A071212|nr:helix-turn-helix transcriptional regulator [Henriciella litoralis]